MIFTIKGRSRQVCLVQIACLNAIGYCPKYTHGYISKVWLLVRITICSFTNFVNITNECFIVLKQMLSVIVVVNVVISNWSYFIIWIAGPIISYLYVIYNLYKFTMKVVFLETMFPQVPITFVTADSIAGFWE